MRVAIKPWRRRDSRKFLYLIGVLVIILFTCMCIDKLPMVINSIIKIAFIVSFEFNVVEKHPLVR